MAGNILDYNKALNQGNGYNYLASQGIVAGPVAQNYKPPATTSVLGASTSNGGGNYNTPSSATAPQNTNNNSNQGYQQIQQGQNNGNAQIEADYNQSMGMLDNAASGLQGQAAQAGGVIDTGASDTKNQIQNTQATAEAGTNASLATGEKQATNAIQQARDVFRQTQQNNSAQLSALGISSSSVAEALAEKLGVDTARRIAGVTGNLQEVRQNATNELGRIKTYYQGQIQTLTQHVADQKAQIQNSLVQGLNQINAARNQAASDKAAARSNLISQVQSQIGQLTQQQQQFQQSLDQWAAQKSAALTPIAQDPNYVNKLIATANTFNQQYAPQGFAFTPQVNVNAQGTMTGQVTPQKLPVDPLTGQPYQTNQSAAVGGVPAGL